MAFDFVVPVTVKSFIKSSMQLSVMSYPLWVSFATYIIIILSVAVTTLLLSQIIEACLDRFIDLQTPVASFLLALIIAYNMTMKFIVPKINSFFLRFARFDVDYEFTSHFHINETGISIDQGDRFTRVAWTAIGGVHETRDVIAFYCRGLHYYIPKVIVGDKSQQEEFLKSCKIWQKNAQGVPIAKTFV